MNLEEFRNTGLDFGEVTPEDGYKKQRKNGENGAWE